MRPEVPVLLIQGSADTLVDPRGIRAYHQQLCEGSHTAFLHVIEGGSHRDALRQSPEIARGFMDQVGTHGQVQACRMDAGTAGPGVGLLDWPDDLLGGQAILPTAPAVLQCANPPPLPVL